MGVFVRSLIQAKAVPMVKANNEAPTENSMELAKVVMVSLSV